MQSTNAPFVVIVLQIVLASAHPSFLKDCPNLNDKYFQQFGQGAVGHSGGISGAKLNPFGHDFSHDGDDTCALRVSEDDDDDDDDDDDHHHHKHPWNMKLCCADSDLDGQYNGWELGDPCCAWRPGRDFPIPGFAVSHPGMASEKTKEPKSSTVCPASLNPCSAFQWREMSKLVGNRTERHPRAAFVQGRNARTAFLANGWHLVDTPVEASLIWVRNRCVIAGYRGEPGQAVNRLPSDQVLSNKVALYETISRSLSAPERLFIPTTMILKGKPDLELIERTFSNSTRADVWILKPASLSKGLGVKVLSNIGEWVSLGGARKALASGNAFVLQRYISNPLLLAGFKSEIRVYFFTACLDPSHVFWFSEGSVRLGAMPYEHGDYNNTLRHVINTAVGKRVLGDAEYSKLVRKSPRKWTFSALAKHLRVSLSSAIDPWPHVVDQLRTAVTRVVRAAAGGLCMGRSDESSPFALFGADFILDDQLQAWMTEVQEGPGLSHLGDTVKAGFVPRMLHQAALMATRIAERKAQGMSLDGIEQETDFTRLSFGEEFVV